MDSPVVSPGTVHRTRMPRIVGGPADPTALLSARRVTVVGCGSVGLVAIAHLARAGIGGLTLVDRGRFGEAAVATHPIAPSAIGRTKATYAGAMARKIRPGIALSVHVAAFQELPLDAADGDAVVLAVDNLGTELAVMQWCLRRGVLLVQCSVHGGTMVATVRSLPLADGGERTCLACSYSSEEWEQVALEPRYACDGTAGRDGMERGPRALHPTRSLSSLCAVAAELGVHRLLRHLLGFGLPLQASALDYRGHTDELVTTRLRPDPDCRLDHARWREGDRAGAASMAEVPAVAAAADDALLAVDRHAYLGETPCRCGAAARVRRFVPEGACPGACDECGRELAFSPFHARPGVTLAALGERARRPLSELGVPAGAAILVHEAEHTTLVLDRSGGPATGAEGGTR